MVQQIHYYMSQQFGSVPNQVKETLVDGRRWIFKSYESWKQTFPWLTDYAFRKVRLLLVELGLIEVKQLGLRQSGRDRTCWYTVNYEHPFLQQLISTDAGTSSSTVDEGERAVSESHSDIKPRAKTLRPNNLTDASVPSSTTTSVDCQRIPITTSNTTSNNLSNKQSEPKKQEAVV
ncbi:hypothetical protein B7486_56305, partial [cyanobacterium TDX16]